MGSENEETLATHPDPTQRTRRQVTDVTAPTQSATYTMKLRANHILCVGGLVLLGLVLLSTQVQAESELEPEPTRGLLWYPGWNHPSDPAHPANNLAHPANWMVPTSHPFHPSHPIGQWLHGRRLLARQVKADDSEQVSQMKADSEVEPEAAQLEPEPTRGLLLYKGWKHPDHDLHPRNHADHPANGIPDNHLLHPEHPIGRWIWG